MKDMYDFYFEISIKKIVAWIVYTFLWLITVIIFYGGAGAGYFNSLIDRTNKIAFYIFWIAVYASVYVVLYKQMFNKNNKVLKSFMLCLASIVILNTLLFCSVKIASFSFRKFSTESWIKYKNERYIMVYDLVNNTDIIGMNVEAVENLLGEPDSYCGKPEKSNERIIYWSGRYVIIFWIMDGKITGWDMW